MELTSDFKPLSDSDGNKVRYKKIAGVVHVKGAVAPTSADNLIGSSTTVPLGTLPTGYRPTNMSHPFFCQGSGKQIACLEITTGGVMRLGRYRDDTGYVTPTTSQVITFYAVFTP